MGMYTEIFFRATLAKDLPEEVVGALQSMTGGIRSPYPPPAHPLFKCPRWDCLGTMNSAYFPIMAESDLVRDTYSKQWELLLHANLKNYHDEIELFFDWIDPYVDAMPGEFLGYSLYEDVEPETAPTPYFKKEARDV